MASMSTPRVDLSRVSVLAEIVVRAGNVEAKAARETLQKAYDLDPDYPDAIGISTVFREGASLDELAREAAFPHKKISFSVVGYLVAELAAAGYELVLYVTPDPQLRNHHTLAVGIGGVVEQVLSDAAANALIRALHVIDNPYRGKP